MTPSPTELVIPEELYKYQRPIPDSLNNDRWNHYHLRHIFFVGGA